MNTMERACPVVLRAATQHKPPLEVLQSRTLVTTVNLPDDMDKDRDIQQKYHLSEHRVMSFPTSVLSSSSPSTSPDHDADDDKQDLSPSPSPPPLSPLNSSPRHSLPSRFSSAGSSPLRSPSDSASSYFLSPGQSHGTGGISSAAVVEASNIIRSFTHQKTDEQSDSQAIGTSQSQHQKHSSTYFHHLMDNRGVLDYPVLQSTSDDYRQPNSNKAMDSSSSEDIPCFCQWGNCQMKLESLQQLVVHIEHIHTMSLQNYVCLWRDCPRNKKPFDARYKLITHLRCHTGERPYCCTYGNCTRKFSRLENLKLHMRTHTGEKPYICHHADCGKRFNNTSDRAKHMKTHITRKPYVCRHPGCSKAYTDPSSMRKHVKFAHKAVKLVNKNAPSNAAASNTPMLFTQTPAGTSLTSPMSAATRPTQLLPILATDKRMTFLSNSLGSSKQQQPMYMMMPLVGTNSDGSGGKSVTVSGGSSGGETCAAAAAAIPLLATTSPTQISPILSPTSTGLQTFYNLQQQPTLISLPPTTPAVIKEEKSATAVSTITNTTTSAAATPPQYVILQPHQPTLLNSASVLNSHVYNASGHQLVSLIPQTVTIGQQQYIQPGLLKTPAIQVPKQQQQLQQHIVMTTPVTTNQSNLSPPSINSHLSYPQMLLSSTQQVFVPVLSLPQQILQDPKE